jgi:hypothetical protein
MCEAQGQEVEPAAAAAAAVTGEDLPLGCSVAATVLGEGPVLEQVLRSMRRVDLDREMLQQSLEAGADAAQAVEVARALADHRWWPAPLREGALGLVAGGHAVPEVTRCLNQLAFSRLSEAQQRVAVAMMGDPDSGYALDGTAVAAALLGIALPSWDRRRPSSRTRVFTAASAAPSGASSRTSA